MQDLQRLACRDGSSVFHSEGQTMPGWTPALLVAAIIAAAFGFGGVAGACAAIAQGLLAILALLAAIALTERAIQDQSVVGLAPERVRESGLAGAFHPLYRLFP